MHLKRLLIFFGCCLLSNLAAGQTLYVAVNGSDANPGTLQKPLGTIQKAVLKARKYKNKATIYLRGGRYNLKSPLLFTAADSRSSTAALLLTAYNDEKPVISSDVELKLKWTLWKDGIYRGQVPDTTLAFDQLFINDNPLVMARYPNYQPGILPYGGAAADALADKRVAKWKNPVNGYIHAMHASLWGDAAYRITGKDSNGKLKIEGGWQNNRPSAMHTKYRFVENILEELDAPNEWYYDKSTGQIYLKPAKGVIISNVKLQVPQLKSLITFRGNENAPVQNITISGVTLMHTLRTFMDTREPLLRSDWCIYRNAAVLLTNAKHINITNCNLTHLGGNAILLSGYNQYCKAEGNLISNIGGSGITFVGDTTAVRSPSYNYRDFIAVKNLDHTPGPANNRYPRYCTAANNLIFETGEVEKQTAGVQISMSRNIEVLHNTICDVPRAGINCNEGTWGGHNIAFNDVFNTVRETGDHGAFNSWGRDRYWHPSRTTMDSIVQTYPGLVFLDAVEPTRLHNNRFRCDNGWDIDLDDGSSNYIITNNICLNGGLKLREGFKRIVQNNIIINNSFHPHVWFKNSGDVF